MKPFLFILVFCTVGLCGCAPALIRYKHVVVHESATIKTTERSTESNDSQGRPLSASKTGLPTKSILSGRGYVVIIRAPVNTEPVVFLRATDEMNNALKIQGSHLLEIEKTSALGLEGYNYSFLVREARGAPIEFEVIAKDGAILGHEKIEYDVVSRGYVWVIDSI
jgi:hypothetical protein